MEMHQGLEYWTADEVAECVTPIPRIDGIYEKLWGFLSEASNPTPAGGDGTNGTVEEPASRLDSSNDDKAPHWWAKLTNEEQTAINAGYEEDHNW